MTYLQVLNNETNLQLSQSAWNYMNDSLRTDIFLRYQPEAVACACIYLSARQLKLALPNRPAWYLLFGVTEQEIDIISYTILKWCMRRKADDEALEKVVEDIRKTQSEAKMKAKGILENNTPQGTGFSPSSRQNTPKQDKTPVDGKKERSKDDDKVDHSPRNRETNHVKKRSRTPDSNKSGRTRSSRSNSTSVSPKRKARTPPRSYKDTRKSRSRSRSRSRSPMHEHTNSKDMKRTSNSSHKRRRSRSPSRSYSRSPHGRHATSTGSGSKKSHHRHHHHHHHHKESRSRFKSRSRSRDRNHRDRSRSRSRSYDKYKQYNRQLAMGW
uniref:Cyclin-like domain-containing protein n=1 Tax=Strigamia maritima TaxID=126957 RepID=T1IVD6_STRMM